MGVGRSDIIGKYRLPTILLLRQDLPRRDGEEGWLVHVVVLSASGKTSQGIEDILSLMSREGGTGQSTDINGRKPPVTPRMRVTTENSS